MTNSVDPAKEYEGRVLIIAQENNSAKVLAKLTEKRGYECCFAPSLDAGIDQCSRMLFDAVVVDASEENAEIELFVKTILEQSSLRLCPLLLVHPDAKSFSPTDELSIPHNTQLIDAPFNPHRLFVKLATLMRMRKMNQDRSQIATTVSDQNAELRDLANRFKREIDEAKEIQRSILPISLPQSERVLFSAVYNPLEEVGGDVYDLWTIRDGVYGLFIGDVTGIGLPAAFIGAMAKIARSYATSDCPSEILQQMNSGMFEHLPPGRYITVAAAVYSSDDGKLQVARGGHPPPLLYRHHQGLIEEIKPYGLAIGIERGAEFELFETSTEPGDKLLLFTDGILESANMDGNILGLEGLTTFFEESAANYSLEDCLKQIQLRQKEFCAGRLLRDETTFLAMEIR